MKINSLAFFKKKFFIKELTHKKITHGLKKKLTESELLNQKIDFENILGCKIDRNIFENILYNSLYCPFINTLELNNRNYIQDLFLLSKGKLSKAVNHLFQHNTKKKNYNTNEITSDIANQIDKKGYVVLENYFDSDFIKNIKNQLLEYKYKANSNFRYINTLKNIKNKKTEYSVFQSNLTDKQLSKKSPIFKMISDLFIRDVAGNYFNTNPYVVEICAIYTKKKKLSSNEIHRSAQKFHYDQGHLKFVKVFVYLDDINIPSDGAHSFIESTHENNFKLPINKEAFEKSGIRKSADGIFTGPLKDNWVLSNFKKERIKNFCYPKGTIIIENTTGLHRGNNCKTSDRNLLSFTYSLSAISSVPQERMPTIESTFPNKIDRDFQHLLPLIKSVNKYQNEIGRDFFTYRYTKLEKLIKRLLNKFYNSK